MHRLPPHACMRLSTMQPSGLALVLASASVSFRQLPQAACGIQHPHLRGHSTPAGPLVHAGRRSDGYKTEVVVLLRMQLRALVADPGGACLGCLREIDFTHSAPEHTGLTLQLEKLARAAPALEVLRLSGMGGLYGEVCHARCFVVGRGGGGMCVEQLRGQLQHFHNLVCNPQLYALSQQRVHHMHPSEHAAIDCPQALPSSRPLHRR